MIAPRVFFPALFAIALAGCHANDDAVYSKSFPCSTAAADPSCGTSATGGPMMCFAGAQLGSENSCVEKCASDVTPGSLDESGMVCLSSGGARVPFCKPSGAVACPAGLSCYRTDLLSDQGVCLDIRVCSDDADCTDPGSSCLSGLLTARYPTATLQTSDLHCLHAGCQARGAACPPGEGCLALLVPASMQPPDICVPQCVNLDCPPNFVCSRRVSGPLAPDFCIPGVIGFRCTNDMDCLIGQCEDTGVGFQVCSTTCSEHRDCVPYGPPGFGPFVCADRPAGGGKHCMSPRPISGSACIDDSFCAAGEHCFYWSFYASPIDPKLTGECRVACNDDGTCPARGGIPHVCLIGGGERSCYPGRFGAPCTDDSQCIADLLCLAVPPSDAGDAGGRICSIPCTVDSDCDLDPWTEQFGYCEAGLCRLGRTPDEACTRDTQCRVRNCVGGVCGPQ